MLVYRRVTQTLATDHKQVRMAERSKALRSGRSLVLQAWVRIPLLTNPFLLQNSGQIASCLILHPSVTSKIECTILGRELSRTKIPIGTIRGHQTLLWFSDSYMYLELKTAWWTFLKGSITSAHNVECVGGVSRKIGKCDAEHKNAKFFTWNTRTLIMLLVNQIMFMRTYIEL